MACPPKLCFIDHRLQAMNLTAVENFIVCYFVEPLNSGNLAQGGLMELFQAPALPFIKGPGFTTKQKRG